MTPDTPPSGAPQRAYRSTCPNCGAPVDFQSAASAFAVCSFCRSTLVRDGEALRRTGESAELFDDHSPLQLGASGTHQGVAFTLVGRLQYGYAEGTWNEWHALFDTGRSGWLSEDNGGLVMVFERALEGANRPPPAQRLRAGATESVDGGLWTVASVTQARLIAAQGELPRPPITGQAIVVADLRNTRSEVGTLDYSDPAEPSWSIGRAVALSELQMSGLSGAAEKTLGAGGLTCPSCGSGLEVKLASTQSIVCAQCQAVVDVSAGAGADLKHYAQATGSEPLIPLGSIGRLALSRTGGAQEPTLDWQVAGYAERCEVASGTDEDQVFWREYLLYNRNGGFAFLIDAEDGWSWSAPITGVPERAGDAVKLDGILYRRLYSYSGRTTHVLGEFYWKLQRDQVTHNTDYRGTGASANRHLNREQTAGSGTQEVVWSAGAMLTADSVRRAFRLPHDQLARLERDAAPLSAQPARASIAVLVMVGLFFALIILSRCDGSSDCDDERRTFGEQSNEYQSCLARQRSASRTGGGSFGGFSTGGGHK